MRSAWGLRPAAILILLGPPALANEPTHPLFDDYQGLQEWAFTSEAIEVPPEGIGWTIDVAEWGLESGSIRLQRPTSKGEVTGLVFEGSGRFEMAIPDPVELRQLRRFAGDDELATLEGSFEKLVLRGIGLGPIPELGQPEEGAKYQPSALAKQRHQHWLALRRVDVDASVAAALGSREEVYLRVDMKTREHGWLTFDYDSRRAEEIVVEWFNPDYSVLESWVSLDREADRLDSGRPTSRPRPVVDFHQVEIAADLRQFASESQRGAARIRPIDAQMEAEILFEPLRDGDGVVQLFLHPWAKVETVLNEDSNELAFVRDHLGKRSSAIRKRVYDDSLLVLLDTPLVQGLPRTLRVTYELELSGFAPGRSWYPSATYPGSGLHDPHTAVLTLLQRPNFAARSLGPASTDRTAEGIRTTTWRLDEPIKMLSFVFAKQYHEERFVADGPIEVAAFGSLGGFINQRRVRQLGEDTVSILDFYQELFGLPVMTPNLVVGLVPATHGQAFAGLIHIGDYSTLTDRVAERELFRAHEIAHLWWGHQIGWRSYRDQWLSEGFSHYSAIMYVEAQLDRGEKFMREILTAFSDELTGSIRSDFSQFSQPGVPLLNKRAADRVGPVGHGSRCRVGEAPAAYRSQSYKKGALALHSLRMILRARAGSDETFLEVLRLFIDSFQGKDPSTEDFVRTVENVTGENWDWFFDAWIYRADIPTLTWDYSVSTSDADVVLEIEVEQQHAEPIFALEIPVQVELEDGDEQTLLAFLDQPQKRFQFALEAKPTQVTFNPDHSVLARVRRK